MDECILFSLIENLSYFRLLGQLVEVSNCLPDFRKHIAQIRGQGQGSGKQRGQGSGSQETLLTHLSEKGRLV